MKTLATKTVSNLANILGGHMNMPGGGNGSGGTGSGTGSGTGTGSGGTL